MFDLGFFDLLASGTVLLAGGGPSFDIGNWNIYLQVAILLASVLMVAFFSSAEASLISVNRVRIGYLAEQGNRAARTVNQVLTRHEKFFAAILLTENACIIFATGAGFSSARRIWENPFKVVFEIKS